MKNFKFLYQTLTIMGVLLFSNQIVAQNQFIYEWAFRSAINGANEQINDAVYDSQENVYQTGIQNVTTGMVLVQKINTSGVPQWTKYFTGSSGSYNTGTSITLDTSENVLVCGSFQNTLNAGGSMLNSNGNDDIFLTKFNSFGVHQWSFSIGGVSLDQALSVTTDMNNNIFITGYFIGTVDFDPSGATADLTSAGAEDIFLAKYDANGNYLWAINAGSVDGSNIGYGVVTDSLGDVYISGQFFGTVDFNPSVVTNTLTSNGTADVFVAKYDNNGNYVWAFNIGSNGADGAKNMSIGNDGFLYVTGNFNGTVDFNPGVGVNQLTTPNTHAFLAKYDGLGNYVWGINIGDQSASISNVYGISNNVNNEIVISGSYLNSIDVDPSIGTDTLFANGNHDVFVVVYSKIGTLIKATSLGSTGFDFGYATDLSNSGKIFIGGAFQNTVDFDPGVGIVNLSTSIGYDAFSAQYGMPPCSLPDLPSISSLNNPICFGDSTTLSIISGNLNDASNWYWYSSTCGGTFLGVGNTISVMPLSATDYFVRGEGNCVASSNCSSITVNVNSLPSVSIDVFNPNTICLNSSAINLPIGSPMGGVYSGLGVNGSNFDPAISGVGTFFTTYTYTDANSCSNSDSTEITVNTCVGIENNASIDEVVIAPNPFTNQINFTGLSKKETIISIVDIHGRTVLNHSTNDINTSISTENLSLESFFVRIISENNVIVRKIVKQ